MAEFFSLAIGFAFCWFVYTYWSIPRWFKYFRHVRGVPKLKDAWKKRV